MTDPAGRPEPRLRRATMADAPAIDALMKASIRDLFPACYTPEQTASSTIHIGHVDPMLIEDGTYLVLEADGEGIVACGGWSRRDKLFSGEAAQEGRARLLDPATERATTASTRSSPRWAAAPWRSSRLRNRRR